MPVLILKRLKKQFIGDRSVGWRQNGVILFRFVAGRRRAIAPRRNEGAGLLLRPFRACRVGGGYPGLRFAPPWATILRRFAA